MSPTPEQLRAIPRWAKTTQYVTEVRLFGSKASGDTNEKSDINLAITIGAENPGTVRGTYIARGQRWQKELTELLGANVHISLYDDPNSDAVRQACQKFSVVLFP
jgi:predicted nucleotidyltransferase